MSHFVRLSSATYGNTQMSPTPLLMDLDRVIVVNYTGASTCLMLDTGQAVNVNESTDTIQELLVKLRSVSVYDNQAAQVQTASHSGQVS